MYSVTSIFYSNGSAVDIAKIEGSPVYKAMMRAQKQTFTLPHRPDRVRNESPTSPLPDMLEIWVNSFRNQLRWLARIRSELPSWLGGPPQTPESKALYPMLLALKTASESYAGTKVNVVEVVFAAYASDQLLTSLAAAAKSVSLRMARNVNMLAGKAAVVANRVVDADAECDAENRLVLAIDFGRLALTMTVIDEDCALREVIHGIHDATIRAESWLDETRASLVSKLSGVLRQPQGWESGDRIKALVFYGELSGDKRLRSALREAFEAVDQDIDAVDGFKDRGEECAVDPLYAASMGVAHICWRWLEIEECSGGPFC